MQPHLRAACLVGALLLSTPARADDARKAEATARFSEGVALTDAGKWEEARLKFLQSVSLFRAASTFYNLANVELRTGHHVDAIEHHRTFLQLAETDPRITDQQRERARQAIEDLLKKVGQVDVRAPQGTTVSVDGKALTPAPTEPIPVTPGRHAVEGSRGGAVRSVVVEPQAGQTVRAALDFGPVEAGGPAARPASPEPGGEAQEHDSSWSTARIVTVGALSAAAITGGVLALVFRSSAEDDVAQAQATLGGGRSRLKEDHDTAVTLSTVSLIGMGTFAAAAVVTAIVWPNSSKSSKIARLVPSGGGLTLQGRF